MSSKKEKILARILVVLQSVDGFINVWRDRGQGEPKDPETGTSNFPAAILLDKGEQFVLLGRRGQQGHNPMAPGLFVVTPEIWIILMPRDTIANEGVGDELDGFYKKIYKAVTTDDTLWALCGSDGKIEYHGNSTDMQSGSTLEGQMRMDFAFTYLLNPNDLQS